MKKLTRTGLKRNGFKRESIHRSCLTKALTVDFLIPPGKEVRVEVFAGVNGLCGSFFIRLPAFYFPPKMRNGVVYEISAVLAKALQGVRERKLNDVGMEMGGAFTL